MITRLRRSKGGAVLAQHGNEGDNKDDGGGGKGVEVKEKGV